MKKCLLPLVCLFAFFAPLAFAGVFVSSPANNSTVSGSVSFVASANTSCSKGVASMGIYTAPGVLAYTVSGSHLNKSLNLSPGTYHTVVEDWDYCGGAGTTPVTVTVTQHSGVYISSPANNSTVGSPVNFSASATTTCAKGVNSMGIYTGPYQLAYTAGGSKLNTSLSLGPGTYNANVTEWDNCGGATNTPITITVNAGGKAFYNLQQSGGWRQYGQGPPNFVDCSPSPCDGIAFGMQQGVNNPSLTGQATQYFLGGSATYSDALFNNHLIGDLSSQGLPDSSHTLLPTLHNFTYEVYFWGGNLEASQALEFDINQFFNGMGFIFGHECRIAAGHEWDVWDNTSGRWIPTGVSCYPNSNSWNHLTIQVERTSDNHLLYKSITLNGQTSYLNQYYSPGSAPGWWGITVNYQMDGNYKQTPYSVLLDRFTFTYE